MAHSIVTLTLENNHIAVTSPYSVACNNGARNIGGNFPRVDNDNKEWRFPVNSLSEVKKLYRQHHGAIHTEIDNRASAPIQSNNVQHDSRLDIYRLDVNTVLNSAMDSVKEQLSELIDLPDKYGDLQHSYVELDRENTRNLENIAELKEKIAELEKDNLEIGNYAIQVRDQLAEIEAKQDTNVVNINNR